jgi:hypothetical protein
MARLLTLALALFLASTAAAATITVDDSGGKDYTTIQPAINASVSGDSVIVFDGTYTGAANRALDFGGRNIVLTSKHGTYNTAIDCEGVDRAFVFAGGEDTTAIVSGFTITNGHADGYGGAVYCSFGSTPTIQNCVFQTNSANYGGAVDCHSSAAIIRECQFIGNTAAFFAGAVQIWQSDVRVAACGFINNSATRGGDIYCSAGNPTVRDCSFTGSSVTEEGAGLYLDQTSLSLSACVFNACSADQYGGAMSIWYGGPSVSDCDFIGCSAVYLGGAIDCRGTTTAAIDSCFFLNCSSNGGGAILCALASPSITECTIIGGTDGSAIRCHNGSAPTIEHVTIAAASSGINCDINSHPSISNTIVAFCTDFQALYCDLTSTPEITHSVSYGNAVNDSLCGNRHDNAFVDPLFCGMGYYDLELCANSICVAGNNAWGERVGAYGQGCDACGSLVKATSWGAIKALYR